MCEDSYDEDWYSAHSSSQALVGLAGLVGVSYRTLTLDELLRIANPRFSSLWFSACAFVGEEHLPGLVAVLESHVDAGGSVFLDGPLAILARDAGGDEVYRPMADTFPFLGIRNAGWYDISRYEVRTVSSLHPIAVRAGHAGGTRLTQGLPFGTETFAPLDETAPGSEVLLALVSPDGRTARPYLVVAEPGNGAKVMAIGAYGNYVGPATAFRNEMPAGFYDNLLLPYLIEGMLWLIGPGHQRFVSLHLSHAPMTVIGRLDGDWSDVPAASEATLAYLVDLGRRTGVATVYGIVSSFADRVDWAGFLPGVEALQALGGSVGSHSHTHDNEMSDRLDPVGWANEVAGSLEAIRDGFADTSFVPDAHAFINPGNTIQSRDYGQFFDAIDLYMTHGFETAVPYASGVMGFGLPEGVAARPVINNTPAPDFQWLYLDDWVYTVEQAAELQGKLLDYYQNTVGRGVLYNQMWHDYSMSELGPPLDLPSTARMRPLFDANLTHFEANRIYAPSVTELIGKMHIAHKTVIVSDEEGGELAVLLDLQRVPEEHLLHMAGMGVRVNHGDEAIASVVVDGKVHRAFTHDTVLLPPRVGQDQRLGIRFGTPLEHIPRLTYISKPFTEVVLEEDTLVVRVREPGLATRLCVAAPRGSVVLEASAYRRMEDGELCGRLDFGAQVAAVYVQPLDTGASELFIAAAGRAVLSAGFDAEARTLALEIGPGDAARIDFEAPEAPDEVRVGDDSVAVDFVDGAFSVEIPPATGPVTLEVRTPDPCPDRDGDGVSVCQGDCDDGDPLVGYPCPPEAPVEGGCGCRAGGPGESGAPLAFLVMSLGCLALLRRMGRRRSPSAS